MINWLFNAWAMWNTKPKHPAWTENRVIKTDGTNSNNYVLRGIKNQAVSFFKVEDILKIEHVIIKLHGVTSGQRVIFIVTDKRT
jgi:hypothetical protein